MAITQPSHVAQDRAAVEEAMARMNFVLMAADAGLEPAEVDERRAVLSEVALIDAVQTVAQLWSKLDGALLHNKARILQHSLLRDVDTPWARKLETRVNHGDHLLSARGLGQLLRELLENASLAPQAAFMSYQQMVHLMLSIHTEQYRHPLSHDGLASSDTLDKISAEYRSLNVEETIAVLRETVPDEIANMLADTTLSPHVQRGETEDLWFTTWPDKVVHPDLGTDPSGAFESAHGFPLLDWLVLGEFLETSARAGVVTVTLDQLRSSGASAAAIARFLDEMVLPVETLRQKLHADRNRGSVHQQRYTLTQYPILRINDDTVILLRYQWVLDRFFGTHLYWSAYARLPGYKIPAPRPKSTAEAFSLGMNHVFERRVGDTLTNIVTRSGRAERLITEDELQSTWTERSSSPVSACDWVIKAGNVCLVIDATNHSLDYFLSQGLGTVESYAADMDRVFAGPGGKFEQLAKTIRMLVDRGHSDFGLDPKTVFMPLIVLPSGGVPNLASTDLDLQLRSKITLGQFDGRLLAPAVIPLTELHLLEGMAGRMGFPDVVDTLISWRYACTKRPVPVRLRDYLDAMPNPNRPLPRRILNAGNALLERITEHTASGEEA
jgi:hypothetical protein